MIGRLIMRNSVDTVCSVPADNIWLSISGLSSKAKIELIRRISESLLDTKDKNLKNDSRNRFLALAGSWNDDADSEKMDHAALGLRDCKISRDFSFD